MSKRHTSILPAVAWAVIIFWVSIDADPPSAGSDGSVLWALAPQVGHAVMYAILAALLLSWRWAVWGMAAPMVPTAHIILAVATAYGVGFELFQSTVPERTGSWSDALLNGLGAAVALGSMATLRQYLVRLRLVH